MTRASNSIERCGTSGSSGLHGLAPSMDGLPTKRALTSVGLTKRPSSSNVSNILDEKHACTSLQSLVSRLLQAPRPRFFSDSFTSRATCLRPVHGGGRRLRGGAVDERTQDATSSAERDSRAASPCTSASNMLLKWPLSICQCSFMSARAEVFTQQTPPRSAPCVSICSPANQAASSTVSTVGSAWWR